MTPGLYHYNASHEEVTVTADDIRNGIVRVKRRGLRVAHYTEQQFEKYYTAGKPRTNEHIFSGDQRKLKELASHIDGQKRVIHEQREEIQRLTELLKHNRPWWRWF